VPGSYNSGLATASCSILGRGYVLSCQNSFYSILKGRCKTADGGVRRKRFSISSGYPSGNPSALSSGQTVSRIVHFVAIIQLIMRLSILKAYNGKLESIVSGFAQTIAMADETNMWTIAFLCVLNQFRPSCDCVLPCEEASCKISNLIKSKVSSALLSFSDAVKKNLVLFLPLTLLMQLQRDLIVCVGGPPTRSRCPPLAFPPRPGCGRRPEAN
jgi:hypothetical protein